MATIQQDILETFYQELATSEGFDETLVTQVRNLLEAEKKLNAADLAKLLLLSGDSREDLP